MLDLLLLMSKPSNQQTRNRWAKPLSFFQLVGLNLKNEAYAKNLRNTAKVVNTFHFFKAEHKVVLRV